MAEREEIKIVYTCPKCGQQAIFGEHFCEAAQGRKIRSGMSRQNIYVIIASVLVFAMLFVTTRSFVASLLGIGVLVALYFLVFRSSRRDPRQELLQLARGDQALVERLIQAERKRQPGDSEENYIDRAYKRLLHDRTR